RIVVGDRRVPSVNDHHVEHVERVQTQLQLTRFADADIARNRQIDGAVRATGQDVPARLQTDAVVGRSGHRRGVELSVDIARAALAWITYVDNPGGIVGRAGQVDVGAVVRVAEAQVVLACRPRRQDAGQLPV